jgi:hypothetical protein
MIEEQLHNAHITLDATPAVARNDYGTYEPRCVMGGRFIRTMETAAGEAYDTANEAMERAEQALSDLKEHARSFIAQHGAESLAAS